MSMTKDEKFLLCLEKLGEGTFDKYEVGHMAGLHPKAVDAIGKELLRSNFIKKSGELEIFITPHGKKLVERLKEEKP